MIKIIPQRLCYSVTCCHMLSHTVAHNQWWWL